MPDHAVASCPDCGAPGVGGRAGCQALWDEFFVKSLSDLRYAALRDLAFDTYCMQHLDTYCRSAKSYIAHLTRLCCSLAYDGDPVVYVAIQKSLNGAISTEKPAILADRGDFTIVDVQAATTVEEHSAFVRAWAENVWAAYAVQHDFAHHWIRAALDGNASLPTA